MGLLRYGLENLRLWQELNSFKGFRSYDRTCEQTEIHPKD